MRHRAFIALLSALFCLAARSAVIPTEHVFVFERSTNTNYVCYDINLRDGKLNRKEPLHAYWVLDSGKNTDELTFLDRKIAFGVRTDSVGEEEAVVHLSAYRDVKIRLCRRKGRWVGIVRVNGREMVLQKMFAQMRSPSSMRCLHVDIYGTDAVTGKKVRERVEP